MRFQCKYMCHPYYIPSKSLLPTLLSHNESINVCVYCVRTFDVRRAHVGCLMILLQRRLPLLLAWGAIGRAKER